MRDSRRIGRRAARENDGPEKWFAYYTRPRCEKKVHSLLANKGIESYLPLAPRVRRWHDRDKVVDFPLFPSYVFTLVSRDSVRQVLETPGVLEVVKMNGRPAEIAAEEIENIARLVDGLSPDESSLPMVPLEEGKSITIRKGPFAGVKGVVVERLGKRRVLVGLPSIGVGFEVNVPVGMLTNQ